MGFEERFPRTSKWIRLVGAVAVPLVIMVGPYLFAFGGPAAHGGEGDFPRLSFDRAFYVVLFVGAAAGFGGIAAEIALPHRVEGPAVAVALCIAGLGFSMVVPEWLEWGWLELVPFTYAFVVPPAYLLGALVWQRRKRRQEGLDVDPGEAGPDAHP